MSIRKYAKVALVSGVTLVGGAIAYCIWKALEPEERTVAKDVHVEVATAIDKTPAELFAFWRDLRNLALFMSNLISVTETSERRSHWVARGLNGERVEWDAEIFNERENELIAWRSLDDADIVNAGSVRFEPSSEGHGSVVRVSMNYNPPAGTIGKTLAQLLGRDPEHLIREVLTRLKYLLETGDIATHIGQLSAQTDDLDATRAAAEQDDLDHEKAWSQTT